MRHRPADILIKFKRMFNSCQFTFKWIGNRYGQGCYLGKLFFENKTFQWEEEAKKVREELETNWSRYRKNLKNFLNILNL